MYFAITLHPSYIHLKMTWVASLDIEFFQEFEKTITAKYKILAEMKTQLDSDQNQKQRQTVAKSVQSLPEIPLLSFKT